MPMTQRQVSRRLAAWLPRLRCALSRATVEDTVLSLQPADLKRGHYSWPRRTINPADWSNSPETNTRYSPARLLGGYGSVDRQLSPDPLIEGIRPC